MTSFHVFHAFLREDNGPNPPQLVATKDKNGCWICRFRKKTCKKYGETDPEYDPADHRCYDCKKFNISCCGQGVERPSGPQICTTVRAKTREWISLKLNRRPGVPPLDLSYLWPEQSEASSSLPTPPPENIDYFSESTVSSGYFTSLESPDQSAVELSTVEPYNPLFGATLLTPLPEYGDGFTPPPEYDTSLSDVPPLSFPTLETSQSFATSPSTSIPATFSQLQSGQPLSATPDPSIEVVSPVFPGTEYALESNYWTSIQQDVQSYLQSLGIPHVDASGTCPPVYDSNLGSEGGRPYSITSDYHMTSHTHPAENTVPELSSYSGLADYPLTSYTPPAESAIPELSSYPSSATSSPESEPISEFGPPTPSSFWYGPNSLTVR